MKRGISNLVRLGALALAMAIVPVALPASAQANNNGMNSNAATVGTSSTAIVPGTGMTPAELRDIGYSPEQLAMIENPELAQANTNPIPNNNNPAPASNTNTAATNPNAPQASNAATGSGGGGWGLWGLLGLLGLLGLAKGRRSETVRSDKDRDIRRVA